LACGRHHVIKLFQQVGELIDVRLTTKYDEKSAPHNDACFISFKTAKVWHRLRRLIVDYLVDFPLDPICRK